ncbi:MAG: hypothetical protein IJR28_03665 [Ottowia sp.]|nr:hypothetical protein [Ottowia sp.]
MEKRVVAQHRGAPRICATSSALEKNFFDGMTLLPAQVAGDEVKIA